MIKLYIETISNFPPDYETAKEIHEFKIDVPELEKFLISLTEPNSYTYAKIHSFKLVK